MKTVCIFCGSSSGRSPLYREAAREMGLALAEHGLSLVYGGAKVGLMAVLADTVLAHGGRVTGIMPRSLVDMEVAHQGLSELIIVDTMHQRKQLMESMSDGFIAMPGGFGTLDEIFEMITWSQLKIHQKPCAFYNVNGYFDLLMGFLDRMVADALVVPAYRKMIIEGDQPASILNEMIHYNPPVVDKAEIALGKIRDSSEA